jgi:hypothetical protein
LRAARENQLEEPAIVAWHARASEAMSPSFDGANPTSWWEKYGSGNGGRLEIHVGDSYDFILTESSGFETLDQIPLRNMRAADGTEYVCYHSRETQGTGEACMPLDEWAAKQN